MAEKNLTIIEFEFVNYFSEAVKIFSLPKSVGEIYGLLYASSAPLDMDTIIHKLNISKGSVSQGLKILRSVNAVLDVSEGRKTRYSANIELKALISGIMNQQVAPLMSTTKQSLKAISQHNENTQDPELKSFYKSRVSKLATWRRRGSFLIPIISKILGKTNNK